MTEPNRPRSLYAYFGRLAIIDPPGGGADSVVCGEGFLTPRLVCARRRMYKQKTTFSLILGSME